MLAQRIQNIEESATVAMSTRSRELRAQGIDVINMSIGEPDANTPLYIKEAAKTAIDDNYTHYSPIAGYLPLREAIVHKLKRDNNLTYTPDQIVVSGGAKQSLSHLFLCLLDPDDEVIVPAPFWVSYTDMIKLAEGCPVILPTSVDNDFKVTPQQIQAAITDKTKALIFSSPCNPSGSIYSKEELKAIAELMKDYPHITIISDEIYEHIQYEQKHESIAQFTEVKEQVVVINGVSKSFAMTGWRLGFMAAPITIAKACTKLQGQTTGGANSMTQQAAITAFNIPFESSEENIQMLANFKEKRNTFVKLLSQIKGFKTNMPSGAFYLFPNVEAFFGKTDGTTTITDANDFVMYLLEKAHVAAVSGASFGNPNCIRFSYATALEQLIEAAKRIKQACALLK